MDDFKKLTEQLLKIYINSESVNDLRIENYFDENISLIGTGQHEIYRNLHEFLKSFEFDVKRRGKIRIDIQNLHQEEERLDDDHVLAHGTVDFIGLFKDDSICFKMAILAEKCHNLAFLAAVFPEKTACNPGQFRLYSEHVVGKSG